MVKRFRARPLGDSEFQVSFKEANFGQTPSTVQAGTADRVSIQPIYIPRKTTINAVGFRQGGAGAAATDFRLGIYADNGNTPVGGALLFDSGEVAADGANGPKEKAISPAIEALPGYVWAALLTEDTLFDFIRSGANSLILSTEFQGVFYTLGAFGALTDPCPSITETTAAPFFYIRHTGFR